MLSSNILRRWFFSTWRVEGINVLRETVRGKIKQIEYVSKVPVKSHELSLQQKTLDLSGEKV